MPERATMSSRCEKSAAVVVAQVGSHKGIIKRVSTYRSVVRAIGQESDG
jgi:hypothetical protein